MASKRWNLLIFTIFVCGAVASYQHHITMRQERDRARRTSDKFEVLYTKELDNVAEWKEKLEIQSYTSTRLQALEKELKQSVEQLQEQLKTSREAQDAATAKTAELTATLETTKTQLGTEIQRKQTEIESLLKEVAASKRNYETKWGETEQLKNTLKQLEAQTKALSAKNDGLERQLASQGSELKLLKEQKFVKAPTTTATTMPPTKIPPKTMMPKLVNQTSS